MDITAKANDIVNSTFPQWRPGRWLHLNLEQYHQARIDICQRTKQLLDWGADPDKLHQIYFDISQTEEAKKNIISHINGINYFYDLAYKYINNPPNYKDGWVSGA